MSLKPSTSIAGLDGSETSGEGFKQFLAGIRVMAPLLLGVAPFGIISGVTAIGAGMTPFQAVASSFALFAGSSQLVMYGLIGQGAPVAIIVLTVLIVNLRMSMYSASLAPHFRDLPSGWKSALAYLLTDEAYVLSITGFRRPMTIEEKAWYYAGAALCLWSVWQACNIVGATIGARVPANWSLDFAVPLTFLALLIPAVKDRASGAAAFSAGLAAVLLAGLPYNIGMITATFVGIGSGLFVGRKKK